MHDAAKHTHTDGVCQMFKSCLGYQWWDSFIHDLVGLVLKDQPHVARVAFQRCGTERTRRLEAMAAVRYCHLREIPTVNKTILHCDQMKHSVRTYVKCTYTERTHTHTHRDLVFSEVVSYHKLSLNKLLGPNKHSHTGSIFID